MGILEYRVLHKLQKQSYSKSKPLYTTRSGLAANHGRNNFKIDHSKYPTMQESPYISHSLLVIVLILTPLKTPTSCLARSSKYRYTCHKSQNSSLIRHHRKSVTTIQLFLPLANTVMSYPSDHDYEGANALDARRWHAKADHACRLSVASCHRSPSEGPVVTGVRMWPNPSSRLGRRSGFGIGSHHLSGSLMGVEER